MDGIREKLLAGDILVERKGTGSRILGEIPGKQVVNIILNGISKIEDYSLRRAAVAALFGSVANIFWSIGIVFCNSGLPES